MSVPHHQTDPMNCGGKSETPTLAAILAQLSDEDRTPGVLTACLSAQCTSSLICIQFPINYKLTCTTGREIIQCTGQIFYFHASCKYQILTKFYPRQSEAILNTKPVFMDFVSVACGRATPIGFVASDSQIIRSECGRCLSWIDIYRQILQFHLY